MFDNIEYDNFPFIISSGYDCNYEISSLKNEILPNIKNQFYKEKYFSLNFFDLIFPQPNSLKSTELNNFVLLNLDSVNLNGSICICFLGNQFENEHYLQREPDSPKLATQLSQSLELASASGYSWVNASDGSSLVEVLSLHAGLMSNVKYPLFYFRVSGGPLPMNGEEIIYDNFENENKRMKRLKEKLIRNGLPIKFYGTASEFKNVVESDLIRIFNNFPNKEQNLDFLLISQKCFENERMKLFSCNNNIQEIFKHLDCVYNYLKDWKGPDKSRTAIMRIDDLIEDFYRKEFSDLLKNNYKKMSIRLTSKSLDCQKRRILILTGPRGSGKSTILINWLLTKKQNDKMIIITHYCEASFSSSDLRIMLRRIIKNIRSFCGFVYELDNHEMHLLDDELLALSQEFISVMLLARQLGYSLLIIIDGLDHLGDKCATSAKQIKCTDWIPEVIPDNVRMIISCSVSDSSLVRLKESRIDISIIETLSEDEDVQLALIESGKTDFLARVASFNQTFSDNLLSNIDEWPLIRIPLVQKILAQVYHTLGTTNKWIQFAEKISECQTLVELIRRVLKLNISFLNWELPTVSEKLLKKFSTRKDEKIEDKSIQGWVPDCLGLLALSRDGLNMDLILLSLKLLGYVKEFQVLESDIWSLFHLTRGFILRFHNNKFTFCHSICKETVEHTFLAIASCSSMEARSRECHDSMYIDKRCKLHILLAYNLWNQKDNDENNLLECLHHLDRAYNHETLANIFFNPRVLMSMFDLNFQSLSTWHGNFTNTHHFHYYWKLLNFTNCILVTNIHLLLKQYYDQVFDHDKDCFDHKDLDTLVLLKPNDPKKYFQSEFVQKLEIEIDNENERRHWSSLDNNQKCKFLLFLAKISILLNKKSLARKIFNYIEKISLDSVLTCFILWLDITLDCSFYSVNCTNEYINTVLKRLDDLTINILEDNLYTDPDTVDRVKFLRCLCLVLKCSIHLPSSDPSYYPSDYLELISHSRNFKSIVLKCIINELEYNSKPISENIETIQDKIVLLSNIIVTQETWVGSVHKHVAKLFVNLAMLLKYGNTQSRFKSEACCRRALWTWKKLNCAEDYQYNEEEDTCRELLFNLLLEDPCNSSIIEAKSLIYTTFDIRMKYLGCYHPLTTKLVPITKQINSMDTQMIQQISHKQRMSLSFQKNISGSFSFSNNESNSKAIKSAPFEKHEKHSAGSGYSRKNKSQNSSRCSLQFISRFSDNKDCFSDDIDWNYIARSRPNSKLSKTSGSGSRLTSAISGTQSAYSFYLNSYPVKSSCTSVGSDKPSHIYLGHTSSLTSLTNRNMDRNEKQVRFNTLTSAMKNDVNATEITRIIQNKLRRMKMNDSSTVLMKKRSLSANFSQPYTYIDPIL